MVSAAFGVEAVEGPCGKKDGGGNTECFLVSDELVVGPSAVIGVLMDIDDGLRSWCGRVKQGCCAEDCA